VLIIDADAQEVARVHEPRHVTPAVSQQLIQLERSTRQGEHTRRWITFMEQGLSRPEPNGPAKALEILQIPAIENTAKSFASNLTALAGMAGR
jgi:hypothetical protein